MILPVTRLPISRVVTCIMASTSPTKLLRLKDNRLLAYSVTHSKDTGNTDSNPRDKRTILLANSICAPSASWDHVLSDLSPLGLDIIRYDQPGHDQSDAPEEAGSTTFETLAEDAIHLLESLKITQLYAWVGVSMGGATGAHVAVMKPGLIKKLVICDCPTSSPKVAGVPDPFTPRVVGAQAKGSLTEVIDGTMSRWFTESWKTNNTAEFDRVRQIMLRTSISGFAACVNALTSETFDLNLLATRLGGCVEAVDLVVGEKDANHPQTMAALGSRIQEGFMGEGKRDVKVTTNVISGAGHVCYIDNPSEFLSVVKGLLQPTSE
jgi:3-oxoadipate enol-lactonase